MSFIDSDNNSGGFTPSIYANDQWSNHPGFLGGTWWKDTFFPKKAEEERYQDKYSSIKSQCPYKSGDSCADLDDAYWCYQDIKDASSGSHRTDNRARRAAEARMSDVNKLMSARDCDGRSSGVDTAQSGRAEAEARLEEETTRFREEMKMLQEQSQMQFMQMQQDAMLRQEQMQKEKTNIMLMAGGAVALTILIVMIK